MSGGAATSAGAAQLGRLPREVLHVILEHAAFPLSVWQPQMASGRAMHMDALNDWREMGDDYYDDYMLF